MIEYDREKQYDSKIYYYRDNIKTGSIGLERLRQHKIDAQAKGSTVIEVVQFALISILSDHDMTCHEHK